MSKTYKVIPIESWLGSEWEETSEGEELWLSAKKYSLGEAYEILKKQFGVRNMPLNLIQLGWAKFGFEEDDVDHDGEEMYWRSYYRKGSYPIWYVIDDIEIYGKS